MASSFTTFIFFSSLLLLSLHVPIGDCNFFDHLVPVRHVNITNYLGEDIKLYIHCQSKDDDIGEHTLGFHESLTWEFRSNFLYRSTRFWCDIYWKDWMVMNGTFNAYKAKRDDPRCSSMCWWAVRTDGLYSLNNYNWNWDLLYDFKNRSIPAV